MCVNRDIWPKIKVPGIKFDHNIRPKIKVPGKIKKCLSAVLTRWHIFYTPDWWCHNQVWFYFHLKDWKRSTHYEEDGDVRLSRTVVEIDTPNHNHTHLGGKMFPIFRNSKPGWRWWCCRRWYIRWCPKATESPVMILDFWCQSWGTGETQISTDSLEYEA